MCVETKPGVQGQSLPKAPKDDWPANMILGSFRSHAVLNAEKTYAI